MSQKLTHSQLLQLLNQAKKQVKIDGIYTHYQNPSHQYRVKDIAIIEESEEVGIIYEALYPELEGTTWIRPLKNFTENIRINAKIVPRFKFLK